jgi:hypothetical protein
MGVSAKGELAVQLKEVGLFLPENVGTLARVPLAGGTPREILKDVFRADWAPNGDDLAVLRAAHDGTYQIEYPIGKALGRSAEFIDSLRVSPDGELVAGIDGDAIVTYDRTARRKVLTKGWFFNGLAWSPRGDEIFFVGAHSSSGGNDPALRSVSLASRERVLLSNAVGSGFMTSPPTVVFSWNSGLNAARFHTGRPRTVQSGTSVG